MHKLDSFTTPYKFIDKERDAETGCDYFGARYYSNVLERFISANWSEIPSRCPMPI